MNGGLPPCPAFCAPKRMPVPFKHLMPSPNTKPESSVALVAGTSHSVLFGMPVAREEQRVRARRSRREQTRAAERRRWSSRIRVPRSPKLPHGHARSRPNRFRRRSSTRSPGSQPCHSRDARRRASPSTVLNVPPDVEIRRSVRAVVERRPARSPGRSCPCRARTTSIRSSARCVARRAAGGRERAAGVQRGTAAVVEDGERVHGRVDDRGRAPTTSMPFQRAMRLAPTPPAVANSPPT